VPVEVEVYVHKRSLQELGWIVNFIAIEIILVVKKVTGGFAG
jgi:hypothetical protein